MRQTLRHYHKAKTDMKCDECGGNIPSGSTYTRYSVRTCKVTLKLEYLRVCDACEHDRDWVMQQPEWLGWPDSNDLHRVGQLREEIQMVIEAAPDHRKQTTTERLRAFTDRGRST